MKRVRVIVEGPTEERFVSEPLCKALAPYGVFLFPVVLETLGHRGGYVSYDRLKRDIILALKQDPNCYCTTLVDFYGLGGGYPETGLSPVASAQERVSALEQAIHDDIIRDIPDRRPDIRCLPYIQLHEFEGLLFSDTAKLAEAVYAPNTTAQLRGVRNSFATPEDINNSPNTAPSKRLLKLVPGYDKVLHGNLAAEHIGIDVMRQECPRFSDWYNRLANLDQQPTA